MTFPGSFSACLGAAAVLVMLGAGQAEAVPAPLTSGLPPGGLPGVAVPALDWTDCGDGVYQCTPAQVPLDYHRPAGTRLTLQLRRWRAADPAARIGTLFIYAGGPGSSGWDWVQTFAGSATQEIEVQHRPTEPAAMIQKARVLPVPRTAMSNASCRGRLVLRATRGAVGLDRQSLRGGLQVDQFQSDVRAGGGEQPGAWPTITG